MNILPDIKFNTNLKFAFEYCVVCETLGDGQ